MTAFNVNFELKNGKTITRVLPAASFDEIINQIRNNDGDWFVLGESDVVQLVNLNEVTNISISINNN